jgi:hypothetical protein
MELLELQKQLVKDNPRCWCKCGVEHRDFVPRHYGGYFYTSSMEQGQIRYETVRKAVNEKISPNITVFLKRYCTEFELKYGPSNEYVRPEYANGIEKKLWPLINLKDDRSCVEQPGFIQEHVIQGWLVFAHGRGDDTVTLYNDFKPLFAPPVTYHKVP